LTRAGGGPAGGPWDRPITNTVTEGLNAKIQLRKASARGFRHYDQCRAASLFCCGKLDLRPALNPQRLQKNPFILIEE
jgi:hypothetical protein